MKHKQEAAGQSFRGVAGQPLQCRGSVTKHEGGEKDLAFCRLSGFFEQVTNLHEYWSEHTCYINLHLDNG